MFNRRHRVVPPPSSAHLWVLGTLVLLLLVAAKLGLPGAVETSPETQAFVAHPTVHSTP